MADAVSELLPMQASRKEVLAWAMYDWANSAYSTLSITVLVSYLKTDILPDPAAGTLAWGWGLGLTMLVAAVLSPIVGAIADAHASKRAWLAWTTLVGSLASAGMFFALPGQAWVFVPLFLTANLAFELSQGFYNAFLPEIADDESMGRVSAWGYGLGYVGGGLALLIVLVIFQFGDQLGIPREHEFRKRVSLLLMGLWWGVFSLPMLLWVRDKLPPSRERVPLWAAAHRALGEVKHTLVHIRHYRMLAIFLVGFLIFNDGVQTVITQASVFAGDILKMDVGELVQVILMIQFLAWPGAVLVGWLADRWGQKTGAESLPGRVGGNSGRFAVRHDQAGVLVDGRRRGAGAGGHAIGQPHDDGADDSGAPYAEFFGFFNLSGKATSMFGPIFFSSILAATGDAHWALLSLLVFFGVGWAIIVPLDIARGQQQARQ